MLLVLAMDHSLLAVYYLVPQVGLLQTRPGGREGEEGKVIEDLTPAGLGRAAGIGGVTLWEAMTLGKSGMVKGSGETLK